MTLDEQIKWCDTNLGYLRATGRLETNPDIVHLVAIQESLHRLKNLEK